MKACCKLLQTARSLWLALAMCSATATASTNALFASGSDAYANEDYAEAARTFSESAQLKPAAGTFLNLGLSEWQRGRTGPAVLAWERSLWIDPYNAAARENLRFARKAAQLESPEYAWYEAASFWLPVNAWVWVASGCLWFAVALITLPRVLRWRRANWHQALAATGFAFFLLCLPSLYGIHTRARIGFVLEKDTELRLTPTIEAQTVMLLSAGHPVRWQQQHGKYWFVQTGYGKGWVERSKLGRVCLE